jgi:hypothetical protein
MAETIKISVVLSSEEFRRFDAYCADRGYKKSTLVARLIREHLDKEGFELSEARGGGTSQPLQSERTKRIPRRSTR